MFILSLRGGSGLECFGAAQKAGIILFWSSLGAVKGQLRSSFLGSNIIVNQNHLWYKKFPVVFTKLSVVTRITNYKFVCMYVIQNMPISYSD